MKTNDLMNFMDILFIVGGLYMLYGAFLLIKKNEIKKGLILSNGQDPSKCKDIEGYKKYIGPRLVTFALCAVITGAAGILRYKIPDFPEALYWIIYILFFASIVWFAISTKSAEKKFF